MNITELIREAINRDKCRYIAQNGQRVGVATQIG